MGLRCSLFDHDFAEYGDERERTDHGEKVVATVRTLERCRRCGHTRVVAENTEITTAATTAERADDGSETETAGTATSDVNRIERAVDAGTSGSTDAMTDGRTMSAGAGGSADEYSFEPPASEATNRSLAESKLQCRICEFAADVLGSSLRAGDSCPSCGRGYLVRTRKR